MEQPRKTVSFNPEVAVGTAAGSSTPSPLTPAPLGGGGVGAGLFQQLNPGAPTFSSTSTSTGGNTNTASTSTHKFGFGFAASPGTSSAAGTSNAPNKAASSSSIGASGASSSTSGFGLGASASTSSTASGQQNPTSENAPTPEMTFRQLQEILNKYVLVDLQDQEKAFQEQVGKVNEWDKVLSSNGEKIAALQSTVDGLKKDHIRVEHGLQFLKNQQMEFEKILAQIDQSMPSSLPLDTPEERLHLHHLAVNLDSDLVQMGVDLKTVIDQINEQNSLDNTLPANDPLMQIMKILNEHTDALQWVEQNCDQVKKSLLAVHKQHTSLKERQTPFITRKKN